MEKIYQGESLNFVFRCKHRCGKPVNMVSTQISVLMKDNYGDIIHRFSTQPLPGVKNIVVEDNYVICRLTREDTSNLSGNYSLEVKVTEGNGELVMIDIVKGIKIYSSMIGEEVSL